MPDGAILGVKPKFWENASFKTIFVDHLKYVHEVLRIIKARAASYIAQRAQPSAL